MDKDLLNVSSIETFFNKILYKNVSDHVFFGGIPQFKDGWKDVVVVDMPSTINDLNAYGRGVVSILLYPTSNKISDDSKNIPVLANLEKKLNEAIENNTSENYIINRMGTMSDYDNNRSLYYNIVFLNLRVF